MKNRLSGLAALVCAAAPFTVAALPAQTITLSPGYTSIGVNQTLQYTATVTGLANKEVTWSVVNIPGGNSTYGTISATGLYKAPATIPANGITVSALGSDRKTLGIVYVNVAPAGPVVSSINPNPIPAGSFTITLTGTAFMPGAMVMMNGNNLLPATYVNASTLKTSAWWGTVGPATFSVINPGTLFGPAYTVAFVQSGPPPPQTIAPTVVSVNLGGDSAVQRA